MSELPSRTHLARLVDYRYTGNGGGRKVFVPICCREKDNGDLPETVLARLVDYRWTGDGGGRKVFVPICCRTGDDEALARMVDYRWTGNGGGRKVFAYVDPCCVQGSSGPNIRSFCEMANDLPDALDFTFAISGCYRAPSISASIHRSGAQALWSVTGVINDSTCFYDFTLSLDCGLGSQGDRWRVSWTLGAGFGASCSDPDAATLAGAANDNNVTSAPFTAEFSGDVTGVAACAGGTFTVAIAE